MLRLVSDGTDAGTTPSVDTLYHVYISNSGASFAPSSMRLSTTAPTALNGVKYLATTGNGAKWRFAGWAYTFDNGSGAELWDDPLRRLVVNYYNRKVECIGTAVNYTNDNALSYWTKSSATYTYYGTTQGNSQLQVISNGEDAIDSFLQPGFVTCTAGDCIFGLAIDGNDPAPSTGHNSSVSGPEVTQGNYMVRRIDTLAAGYHTIVGVVTGTTVNIYSDVARTGATADPKSAKLQASIMV